MIISAHIRSSRAALPEFPSSSEPLPPQLLPPPRAQLCGIGPLKLVPRPKCDACGKTIVKSRGDHDDYILRALGPFQFEYGRVFTPGASLLPAAGAKRRRTATATGRANTAGDADSGSSSGRSQDGLNILPAASGVQTKFATFCWKEECCGSPDGPFDAQLNVLSEYIEAMVREKRGPSGVFCVACMNPSAAFERIGHLRARAGAVSYSRACCVWCRVLAVPPTGDV